MIATDVARRQVADLSIDLVRATCTGHRFRPHLHSDLALGVITTGRHRLHCASGSYTVSEGDIVVLNAEEVHTAESLDGAPWSYRMFYLPERLVQSLAPDRGVGLPSRIWFPSAVLRDPGLSGRLAAAHEDLRLRSEGVARGDFVAALRDFTRLHGVRLDAPAPTHAQRPHEKARTYLDQHYAEPIRLSLLSQVAGVSVFHLIHAFKQAVGLPPAAYLQQVRIARAQGLLRLGCPIAEVARATAFSDQSHFTKRFTRTLGFPPGAYLRAVRCASAGPLVMGGSPYRSA